jgi:hypothetical protein
MKGFMRAAIIMGVVVGLLVLLTVTSLNKMPSNPVVALVLVLSMVPICGLILVIMKFGFVDRVRNRFMSLMKKYYPQYVHLMKKKKRLIFLCFFDKMMLFITKRTREETRMKKLYLVLLVATVMAFVGCNDDGKEKADDKPTVAIQEEENVPVITEAPVVENAQIAVLPLTDRLTEQTQEILALLEKDFVCVYDDGGNIGKRYDRHAENGVPLCVTVDFDTEANDTVSVRVSETEEMEIVAIAELKAYIEEKLAELE